MCVCLHVLDFVSFAFQHFTSVSTKFENTSFFMAFIYLKEMWPVPTTTSKFVKKIITVIA